jgi:hypothetical protein
MVKSGIVTECPISEDQSELILNPAKMSDEGKCTCHAKGLGAEDSAEFTIKGEANEITITPDKTKVTCIGKKQPCAIKFTVTSSLGVKNTHSFAFESKFEFSSPSSQFSE